MPSVALITCLQLPEPDPDEQLLLEALQNAGLAASMVAWDNPSADPGAFDLCVLRSCWNSYQDPERFLTWIAATTAVTELANPAPIVRWNHHKSYLRQLETTGLAVIPTVWCPAGQPTNLARTMDSQGWDDVVIKPSVSAGSYRTQRFLRGQEAPGQKFLDELLADRDTMIQRTIAPPSGIRERALVWIDGELTHAVAKQPRFDEGVESVSAALPLDEAERAFVERSLAQVAGDLLYARVDVMIDHDGELLLSELELIEPSLFLLQCPAALDRLVSAISRRCRAWELR